MKTETLTIDKTFIDRAKELLIIAFGKDVFGIKKTGPITERINSYALACENQSKKVLTIDDFKMIEDKIEREATFAEHQGQTIARSWNEGWIPDFSDGSQYKYYIWGEYKKSSGFSVSYSYYSYSTSLTSVGVRLFFKNDSLAKEFIKQFPELLQQIIKF